MKYFVKNLLQQALIASYELRSLSTDIINAILKDIASELLKKKKIILESNSKDLSKVNDLSDSRYDRIKLTEERLQNMSKEMKHIAILPSPVGNVISKVQRPNGMIIRKVSVPFGVVAVIYESRPNVTFDVFSLCFKSKNVCVLKGGSDADNSNRLLVQIIHKVLQNYHVNPNMCTLLPVERDATTILLKSVGLVDLIIPRGSRSLIQFVQKRSLIPVIETGAGICHTYFDNVGDKEKGRLVITNAKTRRVSVCNALDGLIIHQDRLSDLPYLCSDLSINNVLIYADKRSYQALLHNYPSNLLKNGTKKKFGIEFLDYKMSIKTVNHIDEAISHITNYGSKHSECILSESTESIQLFFQQIDASCVYANVSTAFTDGAQFGIGAEIGISTQKLHVRGPMALNELTTYKYLIDGNGQIRA